MSFVLGILGWGKILLGWLWDAIKGIFKFAVEKPFQFLTIVLIGALLFVSWIASTTHKDLVTTKQVVEEKTKFIKEQKAVLTQYVKALDTEKKNHVADIQSSNQAIARLKKTADAALASAQAAAKKIAAKQQQYKDLAEKYAIVNPIASTAEGRIDLEQQTTDQFIDDWKKAKK